MASIRKPSQLFQLPFLKSHNSGNHRFITMQKVQTFLGANFYPRLNSIHNNLLQSIAKSNTRYLHTYLESQLAQKITNEMTSVQQNRFKFKIHMPKPKITAFRVKRLRKLLFRETVWDNGVTRIGVQCRVVFGEKFHREDPLGSEDQERVSKVYRFGEFRYIRYYPEMGIIGNIRNCYKEQSYQLLVKYASKMHLQIKNFDQPSNVTPSSQQQQKQQQIITQVKMKTGNESFNWVITDINNLMGRK